MKNFLPVLLSLGITLGISFSGSTLRAEITPVELEPETITALMTQRPYSESPDDSMGIAGVRNAKNYLWAKSKVEQNAKAQWQVITPKAEEYTIVALAMLPPNGELKVSSGENSVSAKGHEEGGWQRLTVGSLALPAGQSLLELNLVDAQKAQFKALELLPTAQWPKHLEQVAEYRAKGAEAKFTEKIYGVMFHWGNWSVNQEGERAEWPQMFEDFDIDAWADMVEEMGAAYVVWTISWGEFFCAAPIQAVENVTPGRGTKEFGGRDYFMEMADALNARGIELILYLHHGQGDEKRLGKEKGTFWKDLNNKLGAGLEEVPDYEGRGIFNANYRSIVGEIGERYGKKLYGWWFDDGCLLYPQDFHAVSWNARKGNPNRLVTYNNSKLAPFTDYQDYAAGEWTTGYSREDLDPETGLIVTGRNRGLIPFGLVRAENHWSAFEKAQQILVKGGVNDGFAKAALRAAEVGYCMTFNVMMYRDGSVHPDTMAKLKLAKQALIDAGFERDFQPLER